VQYRTVRAVENIKQVLFKLEKTPHENRFSFGPPLGESLLRALAQFFFPYQDGIPRKFGAVVLLATRRGRQ
jgi:hypothetical protein